MRTKATRTSKTICSGSLPEKETTMKLSQLAVKLGLPATSTEAQIESALDAAVTMANGGPGSGPRKSDDADKARRQPGEGFIRTPSAVSAYHAGKYADEATGEGNNPNRNMGGVNGDDAGPLHADAAQRFEKAAKENPDDKDYHEAKAAHHWEIAAKYGSKKPSALPSAAPKPAANEVAPIAAASDFMTLVNELVRSKGLGFNDAWVNVKMEHPEQYQAMSRPAAVK